MSTAIFILVGVGIVYLVHRTNAALIRERIRQIEEEK